MNTRSSDPADRVMPVQFHKIKVILDQSNNHLATLAITKRDFQWALKL